MDRFDILTKARDFFAHTNVMHNIWYDTYEPLFNEIYFGYYDNERQLLDNLKIKLPSIRRYSLTLFQNISVYTGQVFTHQRYVGSGLYKEFGDICFVTFYSNGTDSFGYINTFQLKVHNHPRCPLLYRSDISQFTFYKNILLRDIFGNDLHNFNGATTEFFYYWIIDKNKINTILEIPISAIHSTGNSFSMLVPRNIYSNSPDRCLGPYQRSILAITGIEIECIKNVRPSLKRIFDYIENISHKDIKNKNNVDNFKYEAKDDNGILPSIFMITSIHME
jgi:hypothetical protein